MAITVYTTPTCQQCKTTKKYLKRRGVEFNEVDITKDEEARQHILEQGFTQAPVVDLGDGDPFYGFRPDRLDAAVKSQVAA